MSQTWSVAAAATLAPDNRAWREPRSSHATEQTYQFLLLKNVGPFQGGSCMLAQQLTQNKAALLELLTNEGQLGFTACMQRCTVGTHSSILAAAAVLLAVFTTRQGQSCVRHGCYNTTLLHQFHSCQRRQLPPSTAPTHSAVSRAPAMPCTTIMSTE